MKIERTKKYHCYNDCIMSGCPGHEMRVTIQTVTECLSLNVDGKFLINFDPTEFETFLELIKSMDYSIFEV